MLQRAPDDFLPSQRVCEMKFGTEITASGTRFRLWAPKRPAVSLKLEKEAAPRPMRQRPRGWHELEVEGVGNGDLYRFMLDDGTLVADPASRFQPQDVLGPSEVVDPRRYAWRDVGWGGRPWHEAVIYELHLGTFTPEGTCRAAIDRLDYLAGLGVTAIQLMPVNDFPGRWNWGYDGALLFAPDSSYGRPDDLKALVEAAHLRSMMVFLDVVYNHFGPKGNSMPDYAPVFTEHYETPWGDAINFDGEGSPTVRDFIIANARYWLTEYHFDGLRLDAVHEMRDQGSNHMLHDLAVQLRGSTDGRYVHLMVENEHNDPDWLRRTEDLRAGLYNAQWNDDFHHVLAVSLDGPASSYFRDYGNHPDWMGRVLASGFAYQGETLPTRDEPKGAPSAELPPTAFISFIQNHDQVGNRLFGERITHLSGLQRQRAAAALYLLSPHIPMIFMGEEWGTKVPFLFFSDVDPDFAEAIRADRQKTFGRFIAEENRGKPAPDPMAEATFEATKLDWPSAAAAPGAETLSFYEALIRIRREEIVPRLEGVGGHAGEHELVAGRATLVRWQMGDGSMLAVLANLSDDPVSGIERPPGRTLWLEGTAENATLGPWTVLWTLTGPGAP